jgi:hypothetical protein
MALLSPTTDAKEGRFLPGGVRALRKTLISQGLAESRRQTFPVP